MPLSLEQGLDFLPPLGLMYLAGYLEQFSEHKIEILDCPVEGINSYSQLKDKIREENPEIVGITAMSFTIVDVIKSAKIIKEVNRQTKIVLGGPHINIFPQETMKIKEVDFLVLGEGEKPFKDLLDNINNIGGLAPPHRHVTEQPHAPASLPQYQISIESCTVLFPAFYAKDETRSLCATNYFCFFEIILRDCNNATGPICVNMLRGNGL